MLEIDLHHKALVTALSDVVRLYNAQVRRRSKVAICVIHGYGSTGVGGVIRHALRAYLMAHGVKYETGEYVENNPGITLVTVGGEVIVDDFLAHWRGGITSREDNVRLFSDLRQRFEEMKEEQDKERYRLSNLLEEAQRHQGELTARLANREAELKRNTALSEELDNKQEELARERERIQVSQDELEALRKESVAAGENALNEGRQRASEELACRREELARKEHDLDARREEQVLDRKQLLSLREEVSIEKARVEHDLRLRTERLNQFVADHSGIEEENRRLREELSKSEKDSSKKQNGERSGVTRRRWLLGSSVLLFLFCLLVATLMQYGCSGPAPNRNVGKQAEKPTPPLAPKSGSPNVQETPRPTAGVPPNVVPAEVPIKTPEQPRVEPVREKPPSGPAATEKQMAYVAGLVRRKGWSEKDRDTEIKKVLGYVRSYQNLTKKEASSLIDAWK